MFSATSVCLSISALAIPLRNYLKTTFLLLVCSHSAPIPMLSELLLGHKTAWLTSTTCCLYFHPSPREEMYVKSSVFEVVCFYCYCGFFVTQVKNYPRFGPKNGSFFQTHPDKLSQQCSLGGWQSTAQGSSRCNYSITFWVGDGLTPFTAVSGS